MNIATTEKPTLLKPLRDNADRIFAGINGTTDAAMCLMALQKPSDYSFLELLGASLYLAANIPMVLAKKDLKISDGFTDQTTWVEKLKAKSLKPLQPSKYPVETYGLITGAGGASFAAAGISKSDMSMLTFGLLTMFSTLYQNFAPSKAEIELSDKSTSTATASHSTIDYIRKNPEKIAAGATIAASFGMITNGAQTHNLNYAICGSCYIAAYSFYAAFVKRETDTAPAR